MGYVISQIGTSLFAEQCLDLKRKVLSEYLFHFWKPYQRVQAIFSYHSNLIEPGSAGTLRLKFSTYDVLHLRNEKMKCCPEVTHKPKIEPFSNKLLSSLRYDWGLLRNLDKIARPDIVFFSCSFQCG